MLRSPTINAQRLRVDRVSVLKESPAEAGQWVGTWRHHGGETREQLIAAGGRRRAIGNRWAWNQAVRITLCFFESRARMRLDMSMGTTMPFSKYNIDPERIEAMKVAFYRVCDALLLKDTATTG
jgi:hypothetical protein